MPLHAMQPYKLFINGQWMDSSSPETVEVINPASEEVVGTIQLAPLKML